VTLQSLRLCQRELAQVREAQEPLQEQLAEVRHELELTRGRLSTLARAAAEDLLMLPRSDALLDRGYRWVRRRKLARLPEWRDAQEVQQSSFFDAGWYLENHPAAAASGLPPALHYVRHGAAEGFDPGPRFSTTGYLSSHPKAAKAGVNPLLHYLRRRNRRPSGQK
jgi:hypothetical protein